MAITDIEDGDVLTGTIWQTIIDTVEDTSTGHDHDGSDSKQIPESLILLSMGAILHQNSVASTTGVAEEEMDSKVLSAGTFTNKDVIRVLVVGPGSINPTKLRIYDGTNTVDVTFTNAGTGSGYRANIYFGNMSIIDNTGMWGGGVTNTGSGAPYSYNVASAMIANWVTSELTLSLRLNPGGAARYLNWSIHKVDGG